ncbi:unnamed protein product, partial [Tenebrio molitor]
METSDTFVLVFSFPSSLCQWGKQKKVAALPPTHYKSDYKLKFIELC